MGIMQAELQERRQWVPKERFMEGLSLANVVPGATATQLSIVLGYARGGWWDSFAVVLLDATVMALVYGRVGALKLMLGGSVLGVLRSRLSSLRVVQSVLSVSTRF